MSYIRAYKLNFPMTGIANHLKLTLLTTQKQLTQQRLYISKEQLLKFWESRTLLEMQQILTIKQEKVIEHLWSYYSHYMQNKKSSSLRNAYCIADKGKGNDSGDVLMWFYDCRIFKSPAYEREDNDMVSSFVIRYKDRATKIGMGENDRQAKQIYQFLNPNLMSDYPTIFKCKASCLLKIYQLFDHLHLEPIDGDAVMITENYYYNFIYSWTHYAHSWDVEPVVRHLFRGLMILLQNQIVLEFAKTLSEKQKEVRRYEKPVAIFQKPKLKETFTMVEEGLGDVEWNTLKISAFKIKYKVVEQEKRYVCYRVKEEDSFNVSMHSKMDELSEEDQKILMAFDKIRASWHNVEY